MPNVSVEVTNYQYEFRAMNAENAAFLYLFDAQNKLLCMAAFVDRTGPPAWPPAKHQRDCLSKFPPL